jgi:hypothetical protein
MRRQRRAAKLGGGPTTGFRVWIAACGNWQPKHAHDWPPEATAMEPAEEGVLSACQAARYVQAFNRAALGQGLRVWAVALPVVVRYEGDLRPGQRLASSARLGSLAGAKRGPPRAGHAPQGLGQSPQCSR